MSHSDSNPQSNPANPFPPAPPPPPPNPVSPDNGLQFDQVDYSNSDSKLPGLVCLACQSPIAGNYYMVNGNIACPQCKDEFKSSAAGGSKIGRMLTAFFFGLGAAVLSAVVYFFFMKFTDTQFALITIGMGWLIGAAVHKGSGGRGGWFYIAIAVVFTYLAIGYSVTTYSVLSEVGGEVTASQAGAGDASNSGADESDLSDLNPEERQYFAWTITGMIAVMGVIAPILLAKSSPLLILIYGFGLWQAAKMNVSAKVNINGPYSAGGSPPPLPK